MDDAAGRQEVKMSVRNCSLKIVYGETISECFEIRTEDAVAATSAG